MPWLIAAVVVLAVAVVGGFVAAYLVADGRRAPDVGGVVPTARASTARSTLAPGETPSLPAGATQQPRRTPTPAPEVTPEPSPLIHVVRRGEYLSYIAGLYCTTVTEILALNEIENPDVVSPRTELLIPGGGCPVEASPAP